MKVRYKIPKKIAESVVNSIRNKLPLEVPTCYTVERIDGMVTIRRAGYTGLSIPMMSDLRKQQTMKPIKFDLGEKKEGRQLLSCILQAYGIKKFGWRWSVTGRASVRLDFRFLYVNKEGVMDWGESLDRYITAVYEQTEVDRFLGFEQRSAGNRFVIDTVGLDQEHCAQIQRKLFTYGLGHTYATTIFKVRKRAATSYVVKLYNTKFHFSNMPHKNQPQKYCMRLTAEALLSFPAGDFKVEKDTSNFVTGTGEENKAHNREREKVFKKSPTDLKQTRGKPKLTMQILLDMIANWKKFNLVDGKLGAKIVMDAAQITVKFEKSTEPAPEKISAVNLACVWIERDPHNYNTKHRRKTGQDLLDYIKHLLEIGLLEDTQHHQRIYFDAYTVGYFDSPQGNCRYWLQLEDDVVVAPTWLDWESSALDD